MTPDTGLVQIEQLPTGSASVLKRCERRIIVTMAFPIKICTVCEEEFELKPDKPGFADRCPSCSTPQSSDPATKRPMDADERKTEREANDARREAMRSLLYRKDS
jgi:hypothetical protein